MLHVSPEDPTSETAGEMIAALAREMAERYPQLGPAGGFRPDDARAPRSVFLVAWFGGEAVGCGALHAVDATTAEVNRLYVAPTARGKGIGREILRELERRAGALGYTRLVVEAGLRQPEAIALFEKGGYERIPAPGTGVGRPSGVCLGRSLAA